MKKNELSVTKENGCDVIRYELLGNEEYDERIADKVNQLSNVIPFQFDNQDGKRILTTYVRDSYSLEMLFTKQLQKREVLCLLGELISVFDMGTQGIPVSYVVKDFNHIYVNEETLRVKCVLVPVKQEAIALSEIPEFFRSVISRMSFDEIDMDNYVAKLLTIVNTKDFSTLKLKTYIDDELEKMGLYISKDKGLTSVNAGGPSGQTKDVKVNRLGVINNMQNSQPPMMGMPPMGMMPPQGQPMMGQPPMGMMPPQGQPMMGQPPMGMMPPQGQPMMGQPPMGMMPPQGQPMMGQPPMGMMPPQGQPMMGQRPQGQAPMGMPPQNQAPQGQPPMGMPPQNQAPQGQPPIGMPPQNQAPQGQPPVGAPPMMGEAPKPATPPMMGEAPKPATPPMMGEAPKPATPPMMGEVPKPATPPMMGMPPQNQAPQGQPPVGAPPMMGEVPKPATPPMMGDAPKPVTPPMMGEAPKPAIPPMMGMPPQNQAPQNQPPLGVPPMMGGMPPMMGQPAPKMDEPAPKDNPFEEIKEEIKEEVKEEVKEETDNNIDNKTEEVKKEAEEIKEEVKEAAAAAPQPILPMSLQPNAPQPATPPMMGDAPKPATPPMMGEAPKPEAAPMMGGLVGQLGSKPVPHLVRVKTGEIINITKPEFSIGKSESKADYTITDNTAVSRVHCIIVQKDGVNYIKDNNSTNHTYLNGVELEPGKEVLLKNKTTVKMGDEEFTFLLRKE